MKNPKSLLSIALLAAASSSIANAALTSGEQAQIPAAQIEINGQILGEVPGEEALQAVKENRLESSYGKGARVIFAQTECRAYRYRNCGDL